MGGGSQTAGGGWGEGAQKDMFGYRGDFPVPVSSMYCLHELLVIKMLKPGLLGLVHLLKLNGNMSVDQK